MTDPITPAAVAARPASVPLVDRLVNSGMSRVAATGFEKKLTADQKTELTGCPDTTFYDAVQKARHDVGLATLKDQKIEARKKNPEG